MRLLVVFCLLFCFTVSAHGEGVERELRVLGPMPARLMPSGAEDKIPSGAMVKLVSAAQARGFIVVEHNKKIYKVEREYADFYLEGGSVGAKFLLGEALGKLNDPSVLLEAPGCVELPGARESSCPWNPDTGSPWTADASRKAVLFCPAEPVNVVPRASNGDTSESCRANEQALDSSSREWSACPVPRSCSAEEQSLLRRQEQYRKQDAKNLCTNQPRTKVQLEKEPRCLLPFQKPIKRLVIHQTDGPSGKGVNNVYNWHRHRGYNDVGYHYIISKDKNGKWAVFEGRPRNFEGAHGGPGSNDDSLGIAIAGCFKSGPPSPTAPCKEEDRPPPEAVRVLHNLVARLKNELKGPDGRPSVAEIAGHGDHRMEHTHCHTGCPSPANQMLVNRLRERYFGGN